MEHADSRRTTILVVMLTIAFVFLLVGLVVIVQWWGERPRRMHHCAKNQSQIMGAMVAYSVNEGLESWITLERPLVASATTAVLARLHTTRLWEGVAASQAIPNSLFSCPHSRNGWIKVEPKPSDPASIWGREPGRIIGYALDWAAPVEPSAERPMIADRDAEAHGGSVMVAFGDAHVTKLTLTNTPARSSGVLVTEGVNGKSFSVGTAYSPDDDLSSTEGDGGDPLRPNGGDLRRAWVR